VELAAGGSPPGQNRFWLHVTVRDTGAGMTPEQLEGAFQPFRQREGGLARNHADLGLGLAVVEKLLRLMRGEIAVRSEPGRGSVVSVRIPLRATERQAVRVPPPGH
jgi:signal transduction histidine kinase